MNSSPAQGASAHPAGFALWLRLVPAFALGYYLSYLMRNTNAVIAPELIADLELSAASLGLLTSAYFLTFGAVQLPLGILLDRFGPRRVEAALLVFAAAGSALFAMADSLPTLIFGRALIGFGVSACLMASFKTFALWYPAERQASLTGTIMMAGGLGALTASAPLAAALPFVGWRGIFLVLAALTLATAIALYLIVPEHPAKPQPEPMGEQWRAVGRILKSRVFWRYAPQLMLLNGGFMAFQGLWAVPWLMQVTGMARGPAAEHLFMLNLAMLVANFGIATLAGRLARRGISSLRLVVAGGSLMLAAELLILAWAAPGWWPWFLLGLFAATTPLAYALLTAEFPRQLSGRVTTALNLMAFVGAFSVQWGFGAAVDALAALGVAPAPAYRLGLAGLIALQALVFAWFLREGRAKAAVCA